MKKNTKGVILKQKGAKMAEDGEDWNGLEMAILKSLTIFFQIPERWCSCFKTVDFIEPPLLEFSQADHVPPVPLVFQAQAQLAERDKQGRERVPIPQNATSCS